MSTERKQILLNRIRTPDGTILTSWNRHDFKTHEDANGQRYMVDGGVDYLRRFVAEEPYEDLSVYLTEDHTKNREAFYWGTRGINGDKPLTYVFLKDMDTDHIEAILETQPQIRGKYIEKIFREELKYRKQYTA